MPQPKHLAFEPNNSKEIAALINRSLQPNITAEVTLKDGCLQVRLESDQVLDQQSVTLLVRNELRSLAGQPFQKVKISARKIGESSLDWQQEFELNQQDSLLTSVPEFTVEVQSSIPSSKLNQKNPSPWRLLFGAVGRTIGGVGSVIQVGQGVVGTAAGVAGTIMGAALQAPQGVKHLLDLVINSPGLRWATKALPVGWLAKFIDRVDVDKAEAEVRSILRKSRARLPIV